MLRKVFPLDSLNSTRVVDLFYVFRIFQRQHKDIQCDSTCYIGHIELNRRYLQLHQSTIHIENCLSARWLFWSYKL